MADFILTDFVNYHECIGQYKIPFIRSSGAVKVKEDDTSVWVAVSESKVAESKKLLENYHAPKKLEIIQVSDREFSEFSGTLLEKNAEYIATGEQKESSFLLEEFSDTAPVVAVINAVFLEAIRKKASDIHIEPTLDYIAVRFRLDGVLHTVRKLDKKLASGLSSRIKVMADLNIMETRLPQDGRLQVSVENTSLDFRVSIIPVTLGESIVLRLFNVDNSIAKLDALGLNEAHVKILKEQSRLPNGLILVSGPTGSGKTTTLHSMIREMDAGALKIITIEDPVERVLDGINQIQIQDEIQLSFDMLLRRVLRQDPNVIMVGEVRDTVTAELALRSALTGHLILSTLHTNDSVSAITRLENMGLQRYLIAAVLRCVFAQRLVRRVCRFCAEKTPIPAHLKKAAQKYGIEKPVHVTAKGCEKCNFTGYSGRLAVSELLLVDDTIADMIASGKPVSSIYTYEKQKGMITLEEDALRKVCTGVTTYSEIKREVLV